MGFAKNKGSIDSRRIRYSTDQLEFGSVFQGDSSIMEFTLANLSTQPISIDSMNVPIPFYTNWNAGTIEAGQSKTVKIFFKPQDELFYFRNLIVFSDANPYTKTITLSGKGENLLPTSIPEDESEALFITYPNPFTDNLSFELNNNFYGKIYLSVINTQGKIIKELIVDKQNALIKKGLDLSLLGQGVYFLKISYENIIISKKITKK
ncbi:T9SS type A sorting domain-containing protein [Flexithrix dorotheae]|uniref:T9SS type A sorting domain-containing protein n=1 Tax=Flexithrix dorotheae TaxID=70993 RepID=UPI003CCB7757